MTGSVFPVTLKSDIEISGDASHAPSLVYTAFDLAGNKIGENLSPQWVRRNGKFKAASHGLAYRQADGSLALMTADEQQFTLAFGE